MADKNTFRFMSMKEINTQGAFAAKAARATGDTKMLNYWRDERQIMLDIAVDGLMSQIIPPPPEDDD